MPENHVPTHQTTSSSQKSTERTSSVNVRIARKLAVCTDTPLAHASEAFCAELEAVATELVILSSGARSQIRRKKPQKMVRKLLARAERKIILLKDVFAGKKLTPQAQNEKKRHPEGWTEEQKKVVKWAGELLQRTYAFELMTREGYDHTGVRKAAAEMHEQMMKIARMLS